LEDTMPEYAVYWEISIEADSPDAAAQGP